jgi:hypothetical protein
MNKHLAVFEGHEIRRVYDEKTETWWFSFVDIVQVLTQQPDFQTARKYWNKLKERLDKEGSQSVTNCHRLKLPAADGKQYPTDVATAETLLRLVQSVPSPKAEFSTRQIAESVDATGMKENKVVAETGGSIAKKARVELEEKTGRKIVSQENYLPPPGTAKKLK